MSLKVQYYRPEAALSAPTPSPLPPPPPEPIAPAPVHNTRLDSQSPPPQKAPKQETVLNFPRKMENAGGREYKYFTEISQMMFVFGEVQDPAPETVNLVEDIVRSQVIELVCGPRDG